MTYNLTDNDIPQITITPLYRQRWRESFLAPVFILSFIFENMLLFVVDIIMLAVFTVNIINSKYLIIMLTVLTVNIIISTYLFLQFYSIFAIT